MVFYTVVSSVIMMAILIGIGVLLKKTDVLNDHVEKGLTSILLNVSLPALVIRAFYIDFSMDKMNLAIKMILISAAFQIFFIMINGLLFKKIIDEEKKKVMLFCGVLTNMGFMGFPIINQVYGVEGTFYNSMFYIPLVISMWTYGIAVFVKSDKGSKKERAKKMFLNANMIAVYLGLIIFFFSIKIPATIMNTVGIVGGMTAALAMFLVGSRIAEAEISSLFKDKELFYVTFVRLMVAPISMAGFLYFSDINDIAKGVCLINSTLPSATLAVILAKEYRGNTLFASKVVVVTHLLSLVSIPLSIWLFL